MFVALMDLLDGKKTYATCVTALVISGVFTFYLEKMEMKEFIEIALISVLFIFKRMGSKSDTQKVINATKEQVDKAVAIVPCDSPVTQSSLDAAVKSIINSQKNQD